MLFNLGAYELIVLVALWAVLVLGMPSALGVYVWRKRKKKNPPKK